MRDPINVLYYPAMAANNTTLKRAILFFDGIHFINRPSFTFDGGLGMIGATSPLRQFEQLFRREGVPLYVHAAPGGPVRGDLNERITSDVNDSQFLKQVPTRPTRLGGVPRPTNRTRRLRGVGHPPGRSAAGDFRGSAGRPDLPSDAHGPLQRSGGCATSICRPLPAVRRI